MYTKYTITRDVFETGPDICTKQGALFGRQSYGFRKTTAAIDPSSGQMLWQLKVVTFKKYVTKMTIRQTAGIWGQPI